MKFSKKVNELFKKAGWYKDRDVSNLFNQIEGIENYPQFAKDFLFSYGGLTVETFRESNEGPIAILDLNVLISKFYNPLDFLNKYRFYGDKLITFPLGDYHLDSASLECDAQGRVYMVGDFPTLMSENFIEGIEKVLMEDYSNTLEWDFEAKKWVR